MHFIGIILYRLRRRHHCALSRSRRQQSLRFHPDNVARNCRRFRCDFYRSGDRALSAGRGRRAYRRRRRGSTRAICLAPAGVGARYIRPRKPTLALGRNAAARDGRRSTTTARRRRSHDGAPPTAGWLKRLVSLRLPIFSTAPRAASAETSISEHDNFDLSVDIVAQPLGCQDGILHGRRIAPHPAPAILRVPYFAHFAPRLAVRSAFHL